MNLSATNMFLSMDMLISSISFLPGSIIIQSQMYSEPTLTIVSLRIYQESVFFYWIFFEVDISEQVPMDRKTISVNKIG
jgi:hypothetical protein